ncbi:MAG: hypothetical protein NW201_13045 [Gemmatimonadales bacterium]|nr:hypothetical protein [Gemmatimonadales bacterium]
MTLQTLRQAALGGVVMLVLAACGGGRPATSAGGGAAPQGAPDAAVRRFFRAVADSNLVEMASLWGTSAGPASVTGQPADWQRRIQVTQLFLRGTRYRILATDDAGAPDRKIVQVDVEREKCTKRVPFTMVRSGAGWLVNIIDLAAAPSPGRPCDEGAQADSAAAK